MRGYLQKNSVMILLSINASRKSREISCLTISGYYPFNQLSLIRMHGYIRHPESKNY